MRRPLLLAAALLLLPTAGAAFDWAGRLGFSWTRGDLWAGETHDVSPQLDLDLGVQLRHYLMSPEVAALRARFDYRFKSRKMNGVTLYRTNTYTYSLGAALFQRRGSPISIVANADRVASDIAGPEGKWFGSRTADAGAVGVQVGLTQLPALSAGYSWLNSTEEIPTMADHRLWSQRLNLSLAHNSPAFSLSTRYSGEWNDGTWDSDAYQLNGVSVDATARLNDTTSFGLSDQYGQRTPQATFDAALASEFHALQANIRHAPEIGEEHFGQYTYSHSSLSTPAMGDAVSSNQSLRYALEKKFDDTEFSVRPTVSAHMVDQTLAAATSRTTGETLAVQGRWYHKADPLIVNVLAGPSVSMLQDADGSNRTGYGAAAQATVSHRFDPVAVNANYTVNYGADTNGLPGWFFNQVLSGGISGPGAGGVLAGQLQLASARAYTPVFGDSASRSVNMTGTYSRGRHEVRASLAVASGLSNVPGTGFVGDGILLTPYDTHSVFAGLAGSTRTTFGVTGSLGVHYATSVGPGQPDLDQYGAIASLGYAFGDFRVSLRDTLTIYGYPTGRLTTNLIMLNLARAIGRGF